MQVEEDHERFVSGHTICIMGQSVTRVKDQFSKLVSSEEGEGIFRREISVVQKEAAVFKDVALLTREKLKGRKSIVCLKID